MPSFDVVSDFDAHEASNGIDQANREVNTRFDFKGTGSKFELDGQLITLTSQSDFQLKQMLDIMRQKLAKRGIDIACLDEQEPDFSGNEARQQVMMPLRMMTCCLTSVATKPGNRSSCARASIPTSHENS